jgi:hypothetical protein
MFSPRGGFFIEPTAAPPNVWGNNLFFPTNANQFVSKPATTNLVTWKATSGFTVEYWGYWTQFGATIQGGPGNQDGAGTNYWSFGPYTGGTLQFYYWGPGTSYITTAAGVVPLNTWTNISAVFTTTGTSTTANLYVNGVRQNIQLNNAGSFLPQQVTTAGVISTGTVFGMGRYGANVVGGFYNNLRVSNVNRYSGASYTLATSSFVSDASTQILIQPTGPVGTTIPYTGAVSGNMTNNLNLATVTATRTNHT